MADTRRSFCPHVNTVGENCWDDFNDKRTNPTCDRCGQTDVKDLWLCVYSNCLEIGCGETSSDHCAEHHQESDHNLSMNLSTLRIWCHVCEAEVYLDSRNSPPIVMRRSRYQPEQLVRASDSESSVKPLGLTGLQNIGNSCYMNSALQALSNCPPLANFFLECQGSVRCEKRPGLSKSHMQLMKDMWSKKRPSYVVPSAIAHGIKIVHPMFRGYSQQDAQEFLRTFMDQLHEELKQPCFQLDAGDADSGVTVDSVDDTRSGSTISRTLSGGDRLDSGDGGGSERMEIEDVAETSFDSTSEKSEPAAVSSDGKVTVNSDDTSGVVSPDDLTKLSLSSTPLEEEQLIEPSSGDSKSDIEKAKKLTEPHYRSVISDIFDGQLLSQVQCLTCERVSTTVETFLDLSLPIPTKEQIHFLQSNKGSVMIIVWGRCGILISLPKAIDGHLPEFRLEEEGFELPHAELSFLPILID